MVSAERIELPSPASEAGVLPLNEAEVLVPPAGVALRKEAISTKSEIWLPASTCYAMLFRHALYQLSYGGIDDTCGDRTHILRLKSREPANL